MKPAPKSDQQMFTRRTLAGRWAKSTMTLKRMEKSGQLRFLKIGNSVRYLPEEVERIERGAMVSR